MISLLPFYTPNLCQVSAGIGAHVCANDSCRAVHGWSLHVQLFWWGLELEYIRR